MKKTIIITAAIVVLAVIAIGALFLIKNNAGPANVPSSTSVQNPVGPGTGIPVVPANSAAGNVTGSVAIPSGATISLGDATISSAEISRAIPSDAPRGATLPFQSSKGTLVLKNFYTTAQGYWPPLNVLLLAYNPSFVVWYYRDNSQFSIVVPFGGTSSDADTGAAVLASELGVDQKTLCELPVTAVFMIDRGMDSQSYPLDFCPAPAP